MSVVRFNRSPDEVKWAYVRYLTDTGSQERSADLRWNGQEWVAALPYGAQVMTIVYAQVPRRPRTIWDYFNDY